MKPIFSGKAHRASGTTIEILSMFSTMKERSSTIIFTAINLISAASLFFLFLQTVSSLDFNVISPAEVVLNREFTVKIEADTQEDYDVKIYVHDDTKDFSEIYDGIAWRSPYKFLLTAFPSKKEFLIISHYEGETNLCVKLRKSADPKDVSETCRPIKINSDQQEENEEETEDEETPSEDNNSNENIPNSEENELQENISAAKNDSNIEFLSSEKNLQQERIVLNSPKIQQSSNENGIIATKQQKIRLGIIYAFAIFCVFIIILLALRKL